MDIIVTLIDPGTSVGPFNIYSNVDSFVATIATGVSRASLLAGYTLTGVSNLTTTVKLVSTGTCNSIIFLPVTIKSPTTTTTSSTFTSTSTTSTSSTTSTTTTLSPASNKISVTTVVTSAPTQDCLGTPYPVSITTATAQIFNQNNEAINAPTSIDVVIRCTFAPCTGASPVTVNRTITISAGNSTGSIVWDSSKTVDCGGFGCILETDIYNCVLSNTASLAWKSGTTSC